jgi:ribosomal protein S18 acetylase RimI-like enzyme
METRASASLLRDVVWRALTAYDLKAVVDIAAIVHPGLYEKPEVLAEKQRLYHNGCYLLEIGERPAGYVLSHPWREGRPPELDAPLGAIPGDAGTYYLHDLALLPVARRIGAASRIVNALVKHATARDFRTMSLVAVSGSQGYWEKHGFAVAETAAIAANLQQGYGEGARFMVKPLA